MSKEATTPAEPGHNVRRRLGEAAGSLGRPLREIENEEVIVTAITFDAERKIKALADNEETGVKRGQLINATAVVFTVESDPVTRYFSFSPSLVEKMRGVDPEELPMAARFVRRDLGNGQSVWDVE